MKATRIIAGIGFIGVLFFAGCYMESVEPTRYAVTPDGYVYEVDPYYNDFRLWVNADPEQCEHIRTILVETRNQVIIDRRNAGSDREFTRLSKRRYQAANARISAVLTAEQRARYQPHTAEFRSWVHAQREKPKENRGDERHNDNRPPARDEHDRGGHGH